MDFKIGRYDVYFHTVPQPAANRIAPVAQLFLYDLQEVFRGDVNFHPAKDFQVPFPPVNSYDADSNIFRLIMFDSELGGLLTTLRQGQQCFVRGYDGDAPRISCRDAAGKTLWSAVSGVFGGLLGGTARD